MDGIQNSALPKYIEYKGRTLLNISDQLTKYEGDLDVDKLKPFAPSAAERRRAWRAYFYSETMRGSSKISDVYAEIDTEIDDAVNRFLDGDMSKDELSQTCQDLLTRLSEASDERGYPTPMGAGVDGDQARADTFFSDFRRRILDRAIERNNQEGLQYAANGKDGHWQYYNSDYYYGTESAISAVKDGVMNYCREKGYSDFTFTEPGEEWELKAVGFNYYSDFNSAWSNSFGLTGHKAFVDEDQAPPKDFVWFYEFGGKGKIYMYERKDTDPNTFDPENPLSARMWISYRGEDGKIHKVSKNFAFDGSASDLKSVADLLSFSGKDRDLTRFLQNLRVFSGGYFRQYPATRLDFRA